MKARLTYESGETRVLELEAREEGGVTTVTLAKEEVGEGVAYVDFLYDFFTARVGEDGWLMTDAATQGVMLTYFTERPDFERKTDLAAVPCLALNRGGRAIFAIVTGMRLDMVEVIGVKGGEYYAYPRILLEGDEPYEAIRVELHECEPSYAKMACIYRDYRLSQGCERLSERCARDPRLAKSADSIAVRVRQGWKPVPTPVEEQTPETEPEMHVACTFERVGELVRELERIGVENAEICLVGWNKSGHDGRFPQIFPVEPLLGGEAKLRELITDTKSRGYQIVCHDDATAAYRIADCFDEEYLVKNRDGSPHKRPSCWSGGRPYKICPKRQYELFETKNQPALAEMGFEGIHYIDVMTILPLLKCYDEEHPLNRREYVEYYRKTMELSRKCFGGFSSEGSFDYAADLCDYALYPAFASSLELSEANKKYYDKFVPFWYIVYHGIMLYNPTTFTLNYASKGEANRLQCLELGGRPLACVYANFSTGGNWMGAEDLLCDDDEQLAESARRVKSMEEDYDLLKDERRLFITDHRELASGVFETEYENGTIVRVDYNSLKFEIIRK